MPDWPDAILFDFDGVLVHSEPLHYLAFQEVAKTQGIDVSIEQYYDEMLGYDDRGAFRRLLELNARTIDKPLLLKLAADKKRAAEKLIHAKQYGALPGVEQTVRGLWRSYPLAICSGALGSEIELMLEGIRLRDCFRVIVSAEDVTVGKPDPECYLRGVERLGQRYHRRLNPKNCMVIEDAPRVIDRLKPLGFFCVGIAATVPAERFNNADVILNSLDLAELKSKLPRLDVFEG
jgi:beta-phosphoglucomutase